MKKRLLFLLLAFLLLVGCSNTDKNSSPVIEGANGIECIVNSTIDLLSGVIAYDEEDGDITPKMEISIMPFVNVSNGYTIFSEAGNYKIIYSVEDSNGNKVSKSSDITVVERDVYLNFSKINGFYTVSSGHAVLEKGGMYNNVYSVEATNCEVSEDLSIERVYSLDTGYAYTFRYYFNTLNSGNVRVLINGKIAHEQYVNAGDNVVTFDYNAVNSNVTISLLLGDLGETVKCVFNKAEYERPQEEGLIELLAGFNVHGRFDGTEGNAFIVDAGLKAKLEVTSATTEMWRGGMFIETGVDMVVGQSYIVSFDIERSNNSPCEVALQNQQWDEKKYASILIDSLESKTFHTSEFIVNEENKGKLWLYVQSGNNINDITISNISVKTYLSGKKVETLTLSDFYNSNDGFNCTLETYAGGFKYFIESFASVDYQQKVTSPEFYINGSGNNFIVSFKASASKPIDVVFAAPIAGGWDPTWIWASFTITEEEKIYTFNCNSSGSDRYNVFVWQFGSSNNQKYSNVTIEISDIIISYKNAEYDGE